MDIFWNPKLGLNPGCFSGRGSLYPQGFVSAKVHPPRQPQIKRQTISTLRSQLQSNRKGNNCQASYMTKCSCKSLENQHLHTLSPVQENITTCIYFPYTNTINQNHHPYDFVDVFLWKVYQENQVDKTAESVQQQICYSAERLYLKDVYEFICSIY